MAEAAGIRIRVFVSSPGDVVAERDRVDRVAQRLNAAYLGAVRIETVRWERAYYTADSTFQRQIVDPADCDVVISIFWQRLGSELPPEFEPMPDGRPYPSGTVYELVKGLEASRKSDKGVPDVIVYRKMADAAVPMSDRHRYREAHAQREAFLAFWEEWFVSEQGHFKSAYNTFDTSDDFEQKLEDHLRAWLTKQGYGAGAHSWRLTERGSPFCSLEPFDADHEEVFFGRERDIRRAIERLAASGASAGRLPFLLLLGESGSGKSSLARAGVVPRLLRGALGGEPAAWRAAILKPRAAVDPLTALAEALCAPGALPEIMAGDFKNPEMLTALFLSDLGTTPVLNALDRVAEKVRVDLGADQAPSGGLVILVDQLEELFAASVSEQVRETFAAAIKKLLATGRVMAVGTLRSDAYAEFTRTPGLLALKEAGAALDVTTPGPAEITEIVRAPAATAGLRFGPVPGSTDGLDDLIIRAASGRDALPLLQFTLSRLYESMRERLAAAGGSLASASAADLTLTHADYAAFGGLEGAIGERAEDAFRALAPDAQEKLPRLLRALAAVDLSDTKAGQGGNLQLFEVAYQDIANDAASRALVDALIAARVLVSRQEGGEQRQVRLAHEAVLRTWDRASAIVAEHGDFFRIRAELVAAERRYARQRADKGVRSAAALLLPAGLPLAEAESIRERFVGELSPAVAQFIDRSGRRARFRQRLWAAATVVFAVTAVAATASAYFAVRSEQRAGQNFALAISQANSLVTRLSEEVKHLAISRDVLRRMLAAIERQFEEIARIDPNHPRLLLSRARMLTAFVDNYVDLGETSEALSRAQQCVDIARRLNRSEPANLFVKATLGDCLDRVGNVFAQRSRDEDALKNYREALQVRRELVAAEASRAHRRDLADALRSTGFALLTANQNTEALALLRESVQIARALVEEAPADFAVRRVLIDSLNTNAIVLSQMQQREEALERYRESAGIARRLIVDDADNTTWRRYLSNVLYNSSQELIALNQDDEALAALRESLAIRRALIALDSGNMSWQRELSYILVDIGAFLAKRKQNDEALAAFREAATIIRRLIVVDTGNVTWKNELRRRLPPVAELLIGLGKKDEAVGLIADTIALFRDAVKANPDDTRQKFELGWLISYYALIQSERGETTAAIEAMQESIVLMRAYLEENPNNEEALQNIAVTYSNLGRDTLKQGNRSAALAASVEALKLWRRLVAQAPKNIVYAIELIETLRETAPLAADAKPYLEEALALLRRLEAEGALSDAQRAWIGEIEKSLAEPKPP